MYKLRMTRCRKCRQYFILKTDDYYYTTECNAYFCKNCFESIIGDIDLFNSILEKYNEHRKILSSCVIQECKKGLTTKSYLISKDIFYKMFGNKFINQYDIADM